MSLKCLVKINRKRKYSEICRGSERDCGLSFVEISQTECEDQKWKSGVRVIKSEQNLRSLDKLSSFSEPESRETFFEF